MRNKCSGCTLYQGHIYGFDESMLKCIDLAGEEKWRVRGLGHGALTIADGRLLVTTSEGELIIARATPQGFEEDLRRDVIDGGVFWTAPVLAGGRIFVRGSHGDLVALDHREVGNLADAGQSSAAEAGDSPRPRVLVQRHLTASKLGQDDMPAFQMTGILNNDSLGLAGVEVTWESDAGGRWHSHIYIRPYDAHVDHFFDGEIGWELTFRGDELIEGNRLAELRNTNGLRSVFDPLDALKAKTIGRETFRGFDCYRADFLVTEKIARSVFFSIETGLLVGRTSAFEDTVVFGDWRTVDGVQLPFRRTVFDSETGEESRWQFSEAVFRKLDASQFVVPDKLLEKPDAGDSDESD
jgi:outer membrane protein assembly factor BamB